MSVVDLGAERRKRDLRDLFQKLLKWKHKRDHSKDIDLSNRPIYFGSYAMGRNEPRDHEMRMVFLENGVKVGAIHCTFAQWEEMIKKAQTIMDTHKKHTSK